MINPGCSYNQVKILQEKFHLPNSYCDIIINYWLQGITLDGFSISPGSRNNKNVVESLIDTYQDPFFPKEFMDKHRMYQVGSYNTDLICVTAGTDQYQAGEVLYVDEGYDIYNPEDSQIQRLAKDFEQFLIIAGNMEELHTELADNDHLYEQKRQEFIDRLYKLNVDEIYHPSWLRLF